MTRFSVALTALTVLALSACDKRLVVSTDSTVASTASSAPSFDVAMNAIRNNWKYQSDFIVKAAEAMPEANYAFKPVKTVRSFGELVGHIAGAQKLICAAALGDPQPAEDAVEKSAKSKADLVAAIKESNEYCAKAYAISATAATDTATIFGEANTKFGALALNAVHAGEHYGNIVTYMRMKGMVPPSSSPAAPPVSADSAKK